VKAPLVIGCGALARELVALTRRAGFPEVDLTCLPAKLHNRPQLIPAAVEARIRRARADGYERIFVAYADCGTGGQLDRVLEAEGVARLEGAHCYEVYAGRAAFAALSDEEPGTFSLTHLLARNFDRLVVRGLGLDRHPELLPIYFGNYRRLVFLAQTEDPELSRVAQAAADRLGLVFERRFVGLGEMAPAIASFAASRTTALASFAASPSAAIASFATSPAAAIASSATSATTTAGRSRTSFRAPLASDARKRRADLTQAPKSVESLHPTPDSDPIWAQPVENLHQTQVRDGLALRDVSYMHPMQAKVGNLHPMQDPDVLASMGPPTTGEGVSGATSASSRASATGRRHASASSGASASSEASANGRRHAAGVVAA
jgi:hypothetical protein